MVGTKIDRRQQEVARGRSEVEATLYGIGRSWGGTGYTYEQVEELLAKAKDIEFLGCDDPDMALELANKLARS